MVVLALAVLVMVFAPAVEASEKLVIKVTEPFEVAGQMYPAGELTVRAVHNFSPIAQLHEIQVDGKSLGLLRAEGTDGTPAKRDEITFRRSTEGHLILLSVARDGQTTRVFSD